MVNLPFGLQIGKQSAKTQANANPSPAPDSSSDLDQDEPTVPAQTQAPGPTQNKDLTVDDVDRFLSFAHRKSTGSPGTELFSGYGTEEYLRELRGIERARIFDEMRRSDSQCKMLLSAVLNPIRSACWEIEAADDTPEATLDKLFVESCLMGAGACRPFKSMISEVGTIMCVHGACAMEKTFKFVQNDINFGTYHGIGSLSTISPKTIDRWRVDKYTQKLSSIMQISNGDLGKGVTEIPAPYLLVFNIDQDGANYEGIGMFRPIYGNYFRKNIYLKLNAIGTEKYAVPTPVIKIQAGFEKTDGYKALIAALEVYTSGQSNYLIVPNDVDVTFPGASAYDPSKVDGAIDAEDRRMAKAFLANLLELAMNGGGGAMALGSVLSDFFLGGIVYIGDRICEPFNQQLIPELVRMNRGPRQKYPTLKVSGIDNKAGLELSTILDNLVKSKLIVPDDKLEDTLRKRYNLPVKSLIGQRDVTPPSPFGGAPGQPGASPSAPGAPSQSGAPIPKPGDKNGNDGSDGDKVSQPQPGAKTPPTPGKEAAPPVAPPPFAKPPAAPHKQTKFTLSEVIRRRIHGVEHE